MGGQGSGTYRKGTKGVAEKRNSMCVCVCVCVCVQAVSPEEQDEAVSP
jgi:hypothetical protein